MQHSFTTFRETRKTGWNEGYALVTISTTTTTPPPPTLTNEEGGEKSMEEKPQKTQSHSYSCLFRCRPIISGGITNRMQCLKFN